MTTPPTLEQLARANMPSKKHLAIVGCSEKDKERFSSRVNKTSGCWHWNGPKSPKGYGWFGMGGRSVPAHRVAFFIANGFLDAELLVCHHCDTPDCVNPAHLWQGTNADNLRDCRDKGRLHNQMLTHCCRGHEFTPENTRYRGRQRICITCQRFPIRIRPYTPKNNAHENT